MTDRDSGDGWTRCGLGHRHWGRFGAAGLLLVRDGTVLLQLRSAHTHNGNTWSVPGGARDRNESAAIAAVREAAEEIGLTASAVELGPEFVDDHGGWSYTTVVAQLIGPLRLRENYESAAVRWVPVQEVTGLVLHHGFAGSWTEVARLAGLG